MADVVMFTKEVEDPSALGIAVVENGRIVRLVEKPQEPISNLAVIGIYYVRHMPDLYAAIEEQMRRGLSLKNEYFIADAIQLMIDAGAEVIPLPVTEWEDCGNAETLLGTNRYLLQRQNPDVTTRERVGHRFAVVCRRRCRHRALRRRPVCQHRRLASRFAKVSSVTASSKNGQNQRAPCSMARSSDAGPASADWLAA